MKNIFRTYHLIVSHQHSIYSCGPTHLIVSDAVHFVSSTCLHQVSFEHRRTGMPRGTCPFSFLGGSSVHRSGERRHPSTFTVTHRARSTSFRFHHEARVYALRCSKIISWHTPHDFFSSEDENGLPVML